MISLLLLVKRTAYRVVPGLARGFDEWLWIRKKTKALKRRASNCRTPADYFTAVEETELTSLQKPAEIIGLLEMLKAIRAERVCEIGSYDGGTLFLFSQHAEPTAHIISLDIHYGYARRWGFQRLVQAGQTLTCIEADSHAEPTRRRLETVLAGKPLDFLFIDGDHSYEGVSRDFQLYSPLVRPGGIIAFHDIVADFGTRFGTPTASNGGDVWKLWLEIRSLYSGCQEFYHEGPEQDGYGIGVIPWPGSTSPAPKSMTTPEIRAIQD